MSAVTSATHSNITTPAYPATKESKIKAEIEKGLSDLLNSKDVDSQDFTWSLDIDIDTGSLEKCTKYFKEHDLRIPDPLDGKSLDFF